MGRESIGDVHPNAKILSERLRRNPKVLQVFGRHCANDCFEIRGYSLLYPLTEEAGAAIAAGQIRSGKELTVEALMPDFENAQYLYIGMLFATPDTTARSYAKSYLREELARQLAHGKMKFVFGRPATPSGLRLLRDYGFGAIAAEGDIWSISGKRLTDRFG
jgi:hypothetical protein